MFRKSRNPLTALALLAAFALPATLAACGDDDDQKVVVKPEAPSRGQQLIDLQRAYESGAMSRREYEREREKLLED
ncbi:MAG: hypothetical protein AB7F36_10720 [Reyranellaceae bacterium]